jgi:hypothetical protein
MAAAGSRREARKKIVFSGTRRMWQRRGESVKERTKRIK